MIIECTNCHSKYQYDEDRFERKPTKKIKCAKCQHIFEIFNPAFESKAAAAPPAAALGEKTFLKREDRSRIQARENPLEPTAPPPRAVLPTTPLQMPVGKRLSLAVIDGPDAGNVFRIEKPRVTIGRTGADLSLNDTEASRLHAAVEVHELTYTLHDLGSTNGTLLEGQKISAPAELQNHGEFVVGNSTLMLIVTEEG